MDKIMETILNTEPGNIQFGSFILCTGISIALGIFIAGIYMLKNRYTKSFVVTLALIPAMVQIIIMMVNGSIGAGIAVMGTFSLIRFRSAPGTAREIGNIFLAMTVGIAMGMGYAGVAVITAIIVGIAELILQLSVFGEYKRREMLLRITIPESLNGGNVFDEIFEKYTNKSELIQMKTTNMGSLFRLEYRIEMKQQEDLTEMINELRCRNGNLEIVCSSEVSQPEIQGL